MGADKDGEGLADALELFIRTNPREADSDGDRITDTEEIARRSSKLATSSKPKVFSGSLSEEMSTAK